MSGTIARNTLARSVLCRNALAGPSARRAAATATRSVPLTAPSQRLPTSSRCFSSSPLTRAESTTPHSTFSDPAEAESQKALEEGTEALVAGDWDAAKAAYLRSNEIKESSSAHFNLGVIYFQLKDLPSSISAFEKSLQLAPDSPDTHTNLASAHIMSTPPRPDLATEHLKKAALLDPKDGEIWFNLGAVLEACEQLEESLEAYKSARDLGIERAEQNARNVTAKILGAKATAPEHLKEVAAGEAKKGTGAGESN